MPSEALFLQFCLTIYRGYYHELQQVVCEVNAKTSATYALFCLAANPPPKLLFVSVIGFLISNRQAFFFEGMTILILSMLLYLR